MSTRPDIKEFPTGKGRKILERVMDWCADHFPVSGADINCSQGKNGTAINFVGVAQGSVSIRHPFKLIDASDSEGNKIRVLYGTVNSGHPTGMTFGDDPPYILPISIETGVVYLGVTVNADTGAITSRFIGVAASMPANTSTAGHLALGTFSTNPESNRLIIAQSAGGSQMYELCSTTHLFGLV